MTKDDIKNYSMRVTQSSSTELVVITYEIIINYLEAAKTADFTFNLNKAKQFINNLSGCLDFKYELSFNLMGLYLFATRSIVKAIARKDAECIDALIEMFTKLKASFAEVSKEDSDKKSMLNTEKVYAGLTYGKDLRMSEYAVR